MKKCAVGLMIVLLLALPARALDFTAPPAPEGAQELMPAETESFGSGVWKIFKAAVARLKPDLSEAAGVCLSLCAVVLLASTVEGMPGNSKQVTRLVCTLTVGVILLEKTNSLINLGSATVSELSEYGKLLLPVISAALAAQGGITTSTALYAATAALNAFLGLMIAGFLIPLVYMFLALAVANSAVGGHLLQKLKDFIKWLMTWGLKIVLYIFTGFMGITGVVSGAADAAAVKAAKLTISGVVPVIGSILSDASEAVIVGAGVVKNAVGVYGMLALAAVFITPFLKIGVHYLLLKLTAAACGVFGVKGASDLIEDFSSAMGLLLGMTGTICFLLMISTVCFMKGMG